MPVLPPTPPAIVAQQPDTAPFHLARYRDRNRVLLFFAPAASDSALAAEQTALDVRPQGVADRDLVVIRILESGTSTAAGQPIRPSDAAALRHRFHADPGHFTAVLVGKDGHTALRSHEPVVATRLFPLIDAMPMRRIEAAHQRAVRQRAAGPARERTAPQRSANAGAEQERPAQQQPPNAKRAEP